MGTKIMGTIGLVAGVVAAASLVGCNGPKERRPLFPVSGRVLLDGKPLAHAFVVFHPLHAASGDEVRPRGRADANGSFVLWTYKNADGAPAGEYRITVEKYKAPTEWDSALPVNLLPTRYAKPDTSQLTARVQVGANELPPFQLKR
jgi:hypothetical protein